MSGAEYHWRLQAHVCGACFGRVISRKLDPEPAPKGELPKRPKEFRCTNCGLTGRDDIKSVCACGLKIGTRNAGIRCIPNPEVTLECVSEIVAKETA